MTPAIIRVLDEDGLVIVNILKQCDGHPDVAGVELAEVIGPKRVITHGLGGAYVPGSASCGPEELAAHIVVGLKTRHQQGHIYLCRDNWAHDYRYDVATQAGHVWIRAFEGTNLIRSYAKVQTFLKFCKKYQESQDE